jgi:hypothetical protein
MTKHALDRFPLHLGLGAREPEFTGMNWYAPTPSATPPTARKDGWSRCTHSA